MSIQTSLPQNSLSHSEGVAKSNSLPLSHVEDLQDCTERFLHLISLPKTSNVTFCLDGIPFSARYEANENDGKVKVNLWATIGYIPYSAESQQKRQIMLEILSGVRSMSNPRFGLDAQQRIIVTGEYLVPEIELPTFIFLPLIQFLQATRPYIQLIGEVL